MINTEKCVKLELIFPGFNPSNKAKTVKRNLTLNDIENNASFGEFSLYRGMPIRNLNKKLSELIDENNHISFHLLNKNYKLIKDL